MLIALCANQDLLLLRPVVLALLSPLTKIAVPWLLTVLALIAGMLIISTVPLASFSPRSLPQDLLWLSLPSSIK